MAVFDTTFLVLLLEPGANTPNDPATGKPVTHGKARIEHLISTMEQSTEKVVVPTPALSEFLVKADAAADEYLQIMERRSVFQIAPFDKRSAVELAALTAQALAKGDKKGGVNEPWQKVKFDRQIVAIAKVSGEQTIYSDDPGVQTFAKDAGLRALGVADIVLPPKEAQHKLQLEKPQGT